MALGVQVHALRGDVAGDQHADRRGALLERLHHTLLLDVGQAAVEHRDLVILELQIGEQMLAEPGEGRDALGEDDHALLGGAGDALVLQELDEAAVLARAG